MKWFVLALSLIFPSFVAAQTLTVQSGEHADFTRLVILTQDAPEWELGRVEGGYEFRPENTALDYDASRVFNLVPRKRLQDIEKRQDGRLFFAVECECNINAFQIAAGIVIDFRDGLPQEGSRFETAFAEEIVEDPPGNDLVEGAQNRVEAAQIEPSIASSQPFALAREVQDILIGIEPRVIAPRTDFAWVDDFALNLPVMAPLEEVVEIAEQQVEPPKPVEMAVAEQLAPVVAEAPISEEARERIEGIEDDLLMQLSRAANQGLVEADLSETENRLNSVKPRPAGSEKPVVMPSEPAIVSPDAPTLDAHMNLQTAVDRARLSLPPPEPRNSDGGACIRSAYFDVGSWGEDPIAGAGHKVQPPNLIGEFDKPDRDSIKALAKNYLFLTFGAETLSLLNTFQDEVGDLPHLRVIAEVMDFGTTHHVAMDENQMGCNSHVAMWAVLARPMLKKDDRIVKSAVLATFSALPIHLRRHLGPPLIEKFLQIDDTDTANLLRTAIKRAPGDHGEGFDLATARLAIHEGDHYKGVSELTGLVQNDGPLAPQAVIELVDTTLAKGKPLPKSLADTAGAMAHEARGTELGSELLRVQLRAQAANGEITATLFDIQEAEEKGHVSTSTARSLRQELLNTAVSDLNDAAFAEAVSVAEPRLGPSKDAVELRRKLAARLIQIGLTDQGRELLEKNGEIPETDDRLLFAESYVKDQEPDLVMGYLAGLEQPEAVRLRAQAHELAGEFDRAAAAYASLGEAEASLAQSWRAGDLEAVAENGSGDLKRAAEMALDTEDPEAAGPLARNRSLLSKSQNTRDVLNQLLGEDQ